MKYIQTALTISMLLLLPYISVAQEPEVIDSTNLKHLYIYRNSSYLPAFFSFSENYLYAPGYLTGLSVINEQNKTKLYHDTNTYTHPTPVRNICKYIIFRMVNFHLWFL